MYPNGGGEAALMPLCKPPAPITNMGEILLQHLCIHPVPALILRISHCWCFYLEFWVILSGPVLLNTGLEGGVAYARSTSACAGIDAFND